MDVIKRFKDGVTFSPVKVGLYFIETYIRKHAYRNSWRTYVNVLYSYIKIYRNINM